MQTIAAYAPNSEIKELLRALKGPDVTVRALNPKAYKDDAPQCDKCVVHTACGNAAAIYARYTDRGIPVYTWSSEHGFDDGEEDLRKSQDDDPETDKPVSPVATDEDLEAATKTLWGKARKQGISKEALREAIRQRGAESVAGELGTTL